MKRALLIWIGIGVLLPLVGLGGYLYGRRSAESINAPAESRTVLYWRAPMDPTEIYDAPGTSKMGMELVPVYANEQAQTARGTVVVDARTAQTMGVRTQAVTRMDLSRTIRTIGEVQYDDERVFTVNTKVSGWIDQLHVNFVGDEVREGTPLLAIYSPDLVAAQEDFVLALTSLNRAREASLAPYLEDAERLLSSVRKRLEYWDFPAAALARLEAGGEVERNVLLSAPTTGVVVRQNVVDGAYIESGQELFRIADLRTVWVHASFFDNELPWIAEGSPVTMELSYLPGRIYTGVVSYVYPYLREETRDVHVRLIFANPDLELKPGMFANVELEGKVIANTLAVPSESVIRSGARNLVFVAREAGVFEPREIEVGEVGGPGNNYVRVLSGLDEGEEIVTSAQFMLDSESRLQEVIGSMTDERANDSGMDGHDHGSH